MRTSLNAVSFTVLNLILLASTATAQELTTGSVEAVTELVFT